MQKRPPHLIACLLFCTTCFAQQYPFVHYTPKDGLINSRVRKAYQDSKGRMYFMTYGGLSVYDGVRFKNYTTQNGLLSDLVNDVLEVGDDSLLVAVNTCGLNVLVRGELKQYSGSSKGCHIINHLLKSGDGTIYASADDGLYKISGAGTEKLLLSQPVEFLGALSEYKDFLVFTTNDLKHYTGLFLYDKKTDKITDTLLHLTVWSLKTDLNGMVWVCSRDAVQNLDTVAIMSGKLVLRKPYASLADETPMSTGVINFNSRNEPIIMTNKEIFHYSKDKPPLYIASPDPAGLTQLSFIDREDVLWICHDGNGIYKLSNTRFQATDIFYRLNSSGVSSVKSLHSSLAWIAMTDRQWIQHTPTKNRIFRTNLAVNASPLHNNKTHLYAVNYNELYMAPLPKDHETTIRFKKIMTLPDTANFGSHAVIDPNGNIILFETRNICVFQNDKQVFIYPSAAYDLIQGMYVAKNGMLWVTSRANGLAAFSLHPENPARYLQKEMEFTGELITASPRCMIVDRNEIFWIGTRYSGLLAFQYKNNQLKKLHHLQTQNGLTDNFVTSLACDDNDNIIIGTQTGLDRLIRLKDSSYRLENITKGNNIFAYINYTWTEANTAFAVTNAGIVFQLDPVVRTNNITEPQLLITEMKVDGRPVLASSSSLELKYNQRNISVSVAAPTFIDEKQVKYSYLLAGGGNDQWSDTSSVADINLLNLSPGDYTLRVKAFFASTDYSPKEMAFAFRILPPWWQTVLFRLIAASLAMGLSIIAVRFYYRNKLRRQRSILEKQQAIERERTRIATDMHDDLGAGLSRIKFLSETIGIKKQQQLPIEEDITKIREYSHEMIDKMGEIVWALNEKNDSLSDLLSYTRAYAVEYLSQNGIDCSIQAPDSLPADFVSGEFRRNVFLTVKEALHNIIKHAQASAVVLKISTDKDLFIEIKDNGTGFDKNNIRAFSNGIANMEKRIKEIGGRFWIGEDRGTTIRMYVPLNV